MALDLESDLDATADMLRDLQAAPLERDGTTADVTAAWLRRRPTFPLLEFHTRLGDLGDLDDYGATTYRRVEAHSIKVDLGSDIFRCAGIDELIDLKRQAGRPQDLDDIEILQNVRSGSPLSGILDS